LASDSESSRGEGESSERESDSDKEKTKNITGSKTKVKQERKRQKVESESSSADEILSNIAKGKNSTSAQSVSCDEDKKERKVKEMKNPSGKNCSDEDKASDNKI
jgi:uncharacterized protein (DUF2126 family)